MNFSKEEFEKFILENKIIGFFNEPIKLKSGRLSNFYINFRNATSDVFLIDKLSDFVISFVKDLGVNLDCFYGVPEGATKLAIITQYKWAKMQEDLDKGKYVLPMGRGKVKQHGEPKDRFFIGIPKGKVIVLEDVTTTGGSLIENLRKLKDLDIDVIAVVVLCDRNEKRDDGKTVKQAVEELEIPYYSLSNAKDLLPKAFEKYNVSEEVREFVREYYEKYGF